MKDRYNLNLLIDEDGYIIYIDFGFMFFNFFGGVNFESVFFKFMCEFFEVILVNIIILVNFIVVVFVL